MTTNISYLITECFSKAKACGFEKNRFITVGGYRMNCLIRKIHVSKYICRKYENSIHKYTSFINTALIPNHIAGDWGINKTILLCITVSRGKCLKFHKYIITKIRKI